ncbi:hypothetical protein FPRO05_13326 [Fusarium proliferatum]|uniref:Uncharacterized protein n=1 Tax=Gibberella intermedia TaxID=948311 RepID=A0A365N1U9_GIBIN|nr:hypothetical protein FPRO05_13326 [Fusarium proliferatum]
MNAFRRVVRRVRPAPARIIPPPRRVPPPFGAQPVGQLRSLDPRLDYLCYVARKWELQQERQRIAEEQMPWIARLLSRPS